jgi:hypothetical protein
MSFYQYKLKDFRKKSKYRNQKQVFSGRKYDSKFEANFAEELEWRKKAGEIKEIIPQYRIDLRGAQGKKVCSYIVDFKVINADDSVTYFEVKGYSTPEFILKWKMAEQQIAVDEPGSELVLIKK